MDEAPDGDPLGRFVTPGAVVLVGDMHGTHELPAVVARLAALAVGRGLPVAVALEVPSSEQPALDTFSAHEDDAEARAALTASRFWHPDGARVARLGPSPTAPGSAGRWTTAREVRRTGHHGWVNVGHLTPSSPLPASDARRDAGPEESPERPGAPGSPGPRIDP